MANAWGLPDNEVKQIKSGLGIADVSASPVKPVRKKAAAIPGIGDTPDMKSYRFMNAQELADEGAGPVKSLVGGFSGSIANAIAGDKEGKLYEYTSPEAQNRVEGAKISNYMAESLGQVKGRRTVIPGVASVAEAAELPVKTTAAVPAALSNLAANTAVGAVGGNPTISTALEKAAPALSVPPAFPTAAQTAPAIGDDPGSGSAIFGGKKVKYQDIGGIGDPLKPGHDGSGRVKGQAQNSNSLVGNLIDRQDQGIVSQAYKDQVADAVRINAANGMAPTAEQMKTLGMGNTDLVNVLAANNKDGRYDTQITDLQKQQFVDQQGQRLAIDSLNQENEMAHKNKLLAIDAPLIEAQTKNTLAEAKAREFGISPDGIKQGQAKELAAEKKDADKFLTDRHDYWRKYLTENTADLEQAKTTYAQAVGKSPEDLSPEEQQSVSEGFIKSRVIQDLRQRASGSKEAQTMIVAGKLKQAEALLKAQAKNMQPGRNLPGQDAILNEVSTLRKQLKQLRGEA